ncbi:MAG: tyrosine-type recombinase/integrase [Acidimicrobiales bacterium]
MDDASFTRSGGRGRRGRLSRCDVLLKRRPWVSRSRQGLRRQHVDVGRGIVRVVEQAQVLKDGTIVTGPPKTAAGRRTVALPPAVVPAVEAHLDRWAAEGSDGLFFCGSDGQHFRRASFYTAWRRACAAVGITGVRPHDLRHTGNTLAASTGASTKELMQRFGHASPRAALIYQHASHERDVAIALGLDALIRAAVNDDADRPDRTRTGDAAPGVARMWHEPEI